MSDHDEDEGDYEVERILADDVVDGQTFYLVKWKGYADEECTWEPAENFHSSISITEWKDQKARGLGLDDYFLSNLQKRIDDFQARSWQDDDRTKEVKDVNLTDDSDTGRTPTKKKRKVHTTDAGSAAQTVTANVERPRKKGIATHAKSALTSKSAIMHSSFSGIGVRRNTTSRKTAAPTVGSRNVPASKAGQRFRNLSHMNNYRKRAREEPAPNLPPERLRKIEDFDIGREAAHILPVSVDKSPDDNQSPLFIPDRNEVDRPREVSPARSDSVLFPPARIDHQLHADVVPVQTDKLAVSVNTTSPIARVESERTGVKASDGKVSDSNINSPSTVHNTLAFRANLSETPHLSTNREPRPDFEVVPLPPAETLVHASNGRWWYRGDIMCYFSMGNPIGYATILHLKYFPFGVSLVKLKDGERLDLNFEPQAFTKSEFEDSFLNWNASPQAIGLINPFPDTKAPFDEFANYLEQNDAIAVFRYPGDSAHFSLLLYSVDSKTWKSMGHKPGRPDTGRPRLHIAFVPKLIPRHLPSRAPVRAEVSSGSSAQIPDASRTAQQSALTPLTRQQTDPLTKQRSKSPSLSHEIAELDIQATKIPKSPAAYSTRLSSEPQSPSSDCDSIGTESAIMTPRSPLPPPDATRDPRRRIMTEGARQLHDTKSANPNLKIDPKDIGRVYKLRFDYIISPYAQAPRTRLDPNKALFFISFVESHPKESNIIQQWLEKKHGVQSSNIYLDSQRHDWQRFRERVEVASRGKIENIISVILFHQENPNYSALPKLSTILGSDFPSCFSIITKDSDKNKLDITQFRTSRVFPRKTMYLVTESMIVNHLDETMSIMLYFDSTKKPGYHIMMRPNIERWLLRLAADETDDLRRDTLIELLMLIAKLNPIPELETAADQNDDANMSDHDSIEEDSKPPYIISPESIPGYETNSTRLTDSGSTPQTPAAVLREHRDNILSAYFYGYTAINADKIRRFMAFVPTSQWKQHEQVIRQKEQDKTMDCGHVWFWELEKFVNKFCRPVLEKRKEGDKQVAAQA